MLPTSQAVAQSTSQAVARPLQPHCPTRASPEASSERSLLWRGHRNKSSALSTSRTNWPSVLSLRRESRKTVAAASRGTWDEGGASQVEPSEGAEEVQGEGSASGSDDEEGEAATGSGRRRRRKVNMSALLSAEGDQGEASTSSQESLGAGPPSTPSSGRPSSPVPAEAASGDERGRAAQPGAQELGAARASNAGHEPAGATPNTVPGSPGTEVLPGSSSVADILSALESSNTEAPSTDTQAQQDTLSTQSGSPDGLVAAKGQLAPAQAEEGGAPSAQAAGGVSPRSNPGAGRLRRSLFDALRSARAQNTEAGALRVLDAWWEPAQRNSAAVDALLGAVVELGASRTEERKMQRQLLDWVVQARRLSLPGTPAYNLLLRAAAGAMADGPPTSPRGIRRVELIFQEMLRGAMPPDEETFEVLMGVYAGAGQHERAAAAHRLMMSSGLQPTQPVLQMLLKAYCAAKDFPAAQQVMWDLASTDGGLIVEDMNLLLFALSKEGHAAEIKAVLERVLEGSGPNEAGPGAAPAPAPGASGDEAGPHRGSQSQMPAPNSASLRALLRAYSSLGEHARAGEVLDLVKKHRVTPDPKLLSELVSSFAVCGSPTEAEATLLWAWGCGFLHLKTDAPKGAGRDRDRGLGRGPGPQGGGSGGASVAQENAVPLYTSLVYAYAHQRLWAEALDVISEMWRVMPSLVDERPYNVVMGEMASAGEAVRAQGMLAAMEAQGLPPKASSFRTLARAFCVANMPEKAEDILLEMQQRGWRVSEDAVVPLLDAYALSRRPGEVERVVGNLDAFGLTRTPAIASSLIAAFCLVGLPRAAESVFSQAFPAGERRPTPLACAWLIAAHAALGNQEGALRVARLMESLGMPAPREEFARVLGVHAAAGKAKEAQLISEYLARLGLPAVEPQKPKGSPRGLQLA